MTTETSMFGGYHGNMMGYQSSIDLGFDDGFNGF